MGFAYHLHRPVAAAEQEGVLGQRPGVVRVGIPLPLQIPGPAAVGCVAPAMVGRGLEGAGDPVGDEHGNASRTAVGQRRVHRLAQISLARQVIHGVMDEHGVETATLRSGGR